MIHSFASPRARKRAAKWRLAQLIKLHRGCVDCGYTKHAVALQFDHRGDKKGNVSDLIRSDYSWSTIMAEINKCDVRCANCHAVATKRRSVGLDAVTQSVESVRLSWYEEYGSPVVVIDSAGEVVLSHTASSYYQR
jgi:hypothetical protein